MLQKLFVLGRPGSGKTTAHRHIEKYLGERYTSWSIIRYNDYDILQEMFLLEELFPHAHKPKQFAAKEHYSFEVLDFAVLDTALVTLEQRVLGKPLHTNDELVVIEFGRQDYGQALNIFSDPFLQDAYFLFLHAELETCSQRINARITMPPTPDNHFVSEEILRGYYGKQIIPPIITTSRGASIEQHRVKVVNNQGDLHGFNRELEAFIDHILVAAL